MIDDANGESIRHPPKHEFGSLSFGIQGGELFLTRGMLQRHAA
jgi:hypothetical protein